MADETKNVFITDIEHPPHTKFVFYKLLYIKNLLCQPLTRKNFNRLRFMDFWAFFRPKTLHSIKHLRGKPRSI